MTSACEGCKTKRRVRAGLYPFRAACVLAGVMTLNMCFLLACSVNLHRHGDGAAFE